MDKEYIEELLKDEEITNYISRLRTKFPPTMTSINLFKIFFTTLHMLHIKSDVRKNYMFLKENTHNAKLCLSENNKTYEFTYDTIVLKNAIEDFNRNQSGKGIRQTTIELIDIFVNLLN